MPLTPEHPLIPPEVHERITREALELGAWMAREVEDRIKESYLHLQMLADAGLLPEPDSQAPQCQAAPPPSGS